MFEGWDTRVDHYHGDGCWHYFDVNNLPHGYDTRRYPNGCWEWVPNPKSRHRHPPENYDAHMKGAQLPRNPDGPTNIVGPRGKGPTAGQAGGGPGGKGGKHTPGKAKGASGKAGNGPQAKGATAGQAGGAQQKGGKDDRPPLEMPPRRPSAAPERDRGKGPERSRPSDPEPYTRGQYHGRSARPRGEHPDDGGSGAAASSEGQQRPSRGAPASRRDTGGQRWVPRK